MLEGNLVVVEPCLETMLCRANVDSCVTGCGSDSGLVYDVVCHAPSRGQRSFFLQLHCLPDTELASAFPRIFALWLLIIYAMLLIQLKLTFTLFLLNIFCSVCMYVCMTFI